MKNTTNRDRQFFGRRFMLRVDGYAYMYAQENPDKIRAIAENRGVSEQEAGRIYTIGALKAAKRRGTARTYAEALDALEAEQVGSRPDPLLRALSADKTARTVAKYARKTANSPDRTTRVDLVRMAWARMDNQPLTAYAGAAAWIITEAPPKTIKRKHGLNPAKALGVLYTEWEDRKEKDGPEYGAYNATVEKNARAFFAEYKSRLSDTAKGKVNELRAYVDRESGYDPDKAEGVIKGLTSAKGREEPETARLSNFAANLHRGFEHKDAVSCPEFIELLHRYMGGKA
jgi:hypothetical protein